MPNSKTTNIMNKRKYWPLPMNTSVWMEMTNAKVDWIISADNINNRSSALLKYILYSNYKVHSSFLTQDTLLISDPIRDWWVCNQQKPRMVLAFCGAKRRYLTQAPKLSSHLLLKLTQAPKLSSHLLLKGSLRPSRLIKINIIYSYLQRTAAIFKYWT